MKKLLVVFFLLLIMTGCGIQETDKQSEEKKPVAMSIFWGLPVGISTAMSPTLSNSLRENNITATIHTDETIKNVDFSSVVNDQVMILSDFIASIILKDNSDWRIVGRLNNFRVGIMVPNQSTISKFSDLKDKRICGNVSLVKTIKARSESMGVVPETFIKFFQVDDEAIRQKVINSKNGEWDDCDAIIVPDALLAYFQVKNLAKMIDQDMITTVIMTRNQYIQDNPEVMVDFFRAFAKTLNDFRKNMISEKKFIVDGMPVDIAAQVYHITYDNEDNFNEEAEKPLRFYLNKAEIDSFQANADMVFDYAPAKPRLNINDIIDVSYAEKALERKTSQ